jgi:hypothetical protein
MRLIRITLALLAIFITLVINNAPVNAQDN